MSISSYIANKSDAEALIKVILGDEYNIDEDSALNIYQKHISRYLEILNDSIYFFAETKYVDKVYRDSYYCYFSSKFNNYKRDCIRLSLFEGIIQDTDFYDPEKYEYLKERYRGYYVLRPTFPYIIGRSVISPLALTDSSMKICIADYSATAGGLKFSVKGYPHSSQDSESISCAETTIWALMEYFGTKYSYYRPVLPSKIIETLNKVTFERQIPSKGLAAHQISYALKEFGFGTRLYSKAQYDDVFEALLSCYIESGIPVVVLVENRPVGNIGHALLAIGHESIDPASIDNIKEYLVNSQTLNGKIASNNISIYDYDSVDKQFVFIDDNMPVYQKASLSFPTSHYGGEWCSCKITNFIVPLYPKIYLEAFEAKNYVIKFLLTGPQPLHNGAEVVLRVFLASSRSYKHVLARNKLFSGDIKTLLLETEMPKFIWVAEISNKSLIKNGMAHGLLIIDATEPNITHDVNSLIMAAYDGNVLVLEKRTGILTSNQLSLEPFTIYEHNLKSFR